MLSLISHSCAGEARRNCGLQCVAGVQKLPVMSACHQYQYLPVDDWMNEDDLGIKSSHFKVYTWHLLATSSLMIC